MVTNWICPMTATIRPERTCPHDFTNWGCMWLDGHWLNQPHDCTSWGCKELDGSDFLLAPNNACVTTQASKVWIFKKI
jgi:hypothetical protein